MNKFYSETCFLDQPYVKEPKLSVQKFLKNEAPGLVPVEFVRLQLGEGIEVEKTNFETKLQSN